MELTDKDLASIQQVRKLLSNANEAKKQLAKLSQDELDKIVKAISDAAKENAQHLAKLATEETGFGKWEDKKIKNLFASEKVYENIKDLKTVGLIGVDDKKKIREYACPVGVIGALIPSTNPTSTVIYKTLIAIKSGNAIVFSPHPKALNCILETIKIICKAGSEAGMPGGTVSCITIPTLQATTELMKHKYTNLILATGGPGMVKAAYSSGTPAIGVGAGNGPAFIDKTADVGLAIKRIVDSKTFDYGTICASEQSIVIEKAMENAVVNALKENGAYIMDSDEAQMVAKHLFVNNKMNPEIVGKPAVYIAKLAGLSNVPDNTRILVARESGVGASVPYSQEKLTPVLALYIEENVDKVLSKCVDILNFEGVGHSFMMHCNDSELVDRFAKVIPASRIMVNSAGSLGGVGGTTNLFPALTLGCGAAGGSSSSNNIGPMDLINIKRVAYGTVSCITIPTLQATTELMKHK
ncbi:MAG: acetaldehyde dehydrogenase (acetylating), partial [Clostridia bacterium]|nr:acetaldehyde dehydrogenase (acetylating) [Clostridia bacterium]